MQVGDAIGEGFGIYRRFWRHLVPIALVVYLVVSLVSLLLTALLGIVGALASVVISIVGVFLLQAALVEAVADVRDGRADLSLADTLRHAWPRVPAVIGAALLAGLGVALGLVLLVVPGLYLLTIWSALVPVIVLEQRGVFPAFGRSRELVRGYAWTVFGVIVVTFLIQLAFSIVLRIVLAGLDSAVAEYVRDVASNTVVAPFVAAVWTCMYFRLQQLKAGVTTLPGAALRAGP